MSKNASIILIFLTLLISLLFGSSHILIAKYLKGQIYSPLIISKDIPSYTIDETYVYAARTEGALRDTLFLKDPANYENQQKPTLYITETMPAKIMAALSVLTGSVANAFIYSDFIFPPVAFILTFYFLYLLTNKFKISCVGSLTVICGSYLLKYAQFPRSVILNIISDINVGRMTDFSRSFHPQVSYLLVIVSLIFLYLTLVKSKKIYILSLGIISGLMFYNYIYYLAFYVTGIIILLMMLLIYREKAMLKRLTISVLISLFMSIPFIIELTKFINSGMYSNMQDNYINPLQNTFWLSVKILITLILVIRYLKSKKITFIILLSFLLSCLFLVNLQFILGKNIHLSGHIEIRAVYPLILIALFSVLSSLKLNTKKLNFFLGMAASFVILYVALSHTSYAKNFYQFYVLPESERNMLTFLDKNTEKGSVVMSASLRYNSVILSLTHNRVYIPHSFLSFTPSREILERIFIVNKFLNLDQSQVFSLFEKTEEKVNNIKKRVWDFDTCGQWFVYFTRYSKGNYYQCFVGNETLNQIMENYRKYTLNNVELNKYRADYLLIGPYEKSYGFNQNEFESKYKEFVSIVYNDNNYKIYKLKHPLSI